MPRAALPGLPPPGHALRNAALVALVVLAGAGGASHGGPTLVHENGVIVETVTGVAADVAVGADGFAVVGSTVEQVLNEAGSTFRLIPGKGWLAMYDHQGNRRWSAEADFGLHDDFDDAAIDASGDVLVVGNTIGDGPDGPWPWAFKYTGHGVLAWQRNLSEAGRQGERFTGVLLEGGELVVSSIATTPEGWRTRLVRLDGSGHLLSRTFLDVKVWATDIAAAPGGDSYLSGTHPAPDRTRTGCGARVTTAAMVWERCQPKSLYWHVARAGDDLVEVGMEGYDLDPGDHVYAHTVRRAAADGALAWEQMHLRATEQARYIGLGVAVDAAGNVYAAATNGSLNQQALLPDEPWYVVDFDPLDSTEMVSVKYLPSGARDWAVEYGSGLPLIAWANAVDAQGRLIVVGTQSIGTVELQAVTPIILRYQDL